MLHHYEPRLCNAMHSTEWTKHVKTMWVFLCSPRTFTPISRNGASLKPGRWHISFSTDTDWCFLQLWPCISYKWLFQWDYTFYKWGDLVLRTGISGHNCKMGVPPNHPSHERPPLVLRQPCWRLGIPHAETPICWLLRGNSLVMRIQHVVFDIIPLIQ